MDFTGIFNTVWGWIIASVGGVSLAGILTAIIVGCVRGGFARTIEKAGLEKTQEKAAELAAEKAVEKVKKVSFKQSLQPVIESQLKKVTEEAQELVKKELKETQDKYEKLLLVLEALSKYFDNSIGVSDDAKEELKKAIALAKEEPIDESIEEKVEIEEIHEEDVVVEEKPSSTRVER